MVHNLFVVRGLRVPGDAWIISLAVDSDRAADYVFARTTKGSLTTLGYSVPVFDLALPEHSGLAEEIRSAYQVRLNTILKSGHRTSPIDRPNRVM